jgi:hypothetical protein
MTVLITVNKNIYVMLYVMGKVFKSVVKMFFTRSNIFIAL